MIIGGKQQILYSLNNKNIEKVLQYIQDFLEKI